MIFNQGFLAYNVGSVISRLLPEER